MITLLSLSPAFEISSSFLPRTLRHKYKAQFHYPPVFPIMMLHQLCEDIQMKH